MRLRLCLPLSLLFALGLLGCGRVGYLRHLGDAAPDDLASPSDTGLDFATISDAQPDVASDFGMDVPDHDADMGDAAASMDSDVDASNDLGIGSDADSEAGADAEADAHAEFDLGMDAASDVDAGPSPSVLVGLISGSTTEGGHTSSFDIVLDAAPHADVVIDLSSSDASEGFVTPTSVTFTVSDWDVPQIVTVTGVDDDLVDGDVVYSVVTAPVMSGDLRLDGFDPEDVALANIDDDVASVIVTPTAGLVTSEAGASATFSVRLGAEPTADVGISISSDDTGEGVPDVAFLTFTSADWSIPQVVTVVGVDDSAADTATPYNIITSDATSSDPVFSSLVVSDVSVLNDIGPIRTDCSHRWLKDLGFIDSTNRWMTSSDSSVFALGYTGSMFVNVALSEIDGSVVWTLPMVGYTAGGNGARVFVQNSARDFGDGHLLYSVGWGTVYTGGGGGGVTHPVISVGPTDSSSHVFRISPSVGGAMWTLYVGPTPVLTGVGIQNAWLEFDSTGALLAAVNLGPGPVSQPLPREDGRWTYVLNPSADTTIDGHTTPASTRELITLNADLTFHRADPIGSTSRDQITNVPGSNMTVASTSLGLQAFDESGLVWQLTCSTGARVVASATAVYVVGIVTSGASFCGDRIGPTSGIGIAEVDPATGAIRDVRFIDQPTNPLSVSFAIASADDDLYIALSSPGSTGLDVCGDTLAAHGSQTQFLIAL